MENQTTDWKSVEELLLILIQGQQQNLLKLGRRIIPTLTTEDMLQPNDYPELDHHPEFRYEEGILAGMQTVQMALKASRNEGS